MDVIVNCINNENVERKIVINTADIRDVEGLKNAVKARLPDDYAPDALKFNNEILNKESSLASTGIKAGSEITCVRYPNENFNITVEGSGGEAKMKPTNVTVSHRTTTEELMKKINNKSSTTSTDSYLTNGGRNLRPGMTLFDQGITSSSNIQLNYRMRGG